MQQAVRQARASRCKEAVEVAALASSSSASMYSSTAAARRLGLHYLTRYFFLITFQVLGFRV